ncbi:MAG: recombinase family protein [Lachnospiraceae bacterium]
MIGLYARQSIDKLGSLSVEGQLCSCKMEARGQEYREYIDRGYSGKNTKRPGFLLLMEAVRQGEIQAVIVYKLDRISRSLLDFAKMMEFFEQHQVAFISSTEKFDTSTPMGRAMLSVAIIFAQLERETIQARVMDAYEMRCKRGLYMGGRIPFGFQLCDTVVKENSTSMYAPIPEEVKQIRKMYQWYGEPEISLQKVANLLNKEGYRRRSGKEWIAPRIGELLKNPIYVRSNASIYEYYQQQEIQIMNAKEEFQKKKACYLYGCMGGEKNILVVAPHEGLIEAEQFLKVVKKHTLWGRTPYHSG